MSLIYFFPPSNPFLLETTCLFSVSRTVSVLLCLLIFFKIPISEIMQSFFSCDLMTTFSVMFGFLSLFLIISSFLFYLFFIICFSFSFLVCVYYRFLICGYNEFYMQQSLNVIVVIRGFLKFKFIFTTQNYNATPPMFTGFDIILYLFVLCIP